MRSATRHRPSGRLNDGLALSIACLVPLMAVPLASNRPAWWLLWSVVLSGLALIRLVAPFGARREGPRILEHPAILTMAMAMPVWAAVQMTPVAAHLLVGLTAMAPALQPLAGPAISVQPDVAAAGILRVMGYILLLALAVEIASRRARVLRAGQIVYAGICLHAVWAMVALHLLGDIAPWGAKTAYQGSATGTFVNRNSLATFLGFGIVLGLGLLAERVARRSGHGLPRGRAPWQVGLGDLLIGAGMAFLLLALVATQSRLGIVASLIGAAATISLIRWRSGRTAIRSVTEFCAITTAGIGLAALAEGGVAERFLFIGQEMTQRLTLYEQALQMVATRPWTGFGMDAFGAAFEAFRAPPLLTPVTYDLAHNTYLMLWVEFGLVFGSMPIISLAAVGMVLWRRMRAEDGFGGLAIAGLGALAIGAIHSLGDFSLEIPANVYLLMFILGLALGRDRGLPRAAGHRGDTA